MSFRNYVLAIALIIAAAAGVYTVAARGLWPHLPSVGDLFGGSTPVSDSLTTEEKRLTAVAAMYRAEAEDARAAEALAVAKLDTVEHARKAEAAADRARLQLWKDSAASVVAYLGNVVTLDTAGTALIPIDTAIAFVARSDQRCDNAMIQAAIALRACDRRATAAEAEADTLRHAKADADAARAADHRAANQRIAGALGLGALLGWLLHR